MFTLVAWRNLGKIQRYTLQARKVKLQLERRIYGASTQGKILFPLFQESTNKNFTFYIRVGSEELQKLESGIVKKILHN